jgi:hypothetical protein
MRILREPLVHFLIFGFAIFALSRIFAGSNATATGSGGEKTIIVTPEAMLKCGYVLDNLSPAELQQQINTYIREEVMVREARAQSLDTDDSTVRQALVTALERRLQYGAPDPAPPADSVLQDYLSQHATMFKTTDGKPPSLSNSNIHNAVLAAWNNDQRKAAIDAKYQELRQNYTVSVQMSATTKPAGAGKP